MPFLFTPHGYNLRQDARKIGIHDAGIQCFSGSLRDEVYYSNLKFSNKADSYSESCAECAFLDCAPAVHSLALQGTNSSITPR